MERDLPQSANYEKRLLGAILLDNEAISIALEFVRAGDFHHERNRLVFTAMEALHERNQPIDAATLCEELVARKTIGKVGKDYPGELTLAVANAKNIEAHARGLRDLGILRDSIATLQGLTASAFEERNVAAFAARCEKTIENVFSREVEETYVRADVLAEETLRQMEENAGQEITGVATGFRDLDRLLGGLQAGELTVLAARPSLGKTALALNIADRAAGAGVPVAFFSLEMTRRLLMQRLLKSDARVGNPEKRNQIFTAEELDRLREAKTRVARLPIYIDDGELNPTLLRAKARRIRHKLGGLGLIIVDYLQLMRSAERWGDDSRQGEVAEFSRALARLSKTMNVPVLALSQLNRKVEERADKTPKLSDLRESGTIEQDADNVIFIHRENAYATDHVAEPGPAYLILSKARNGPRGVVELMYIPQYTRFENSEHFHTESDEEVPF